MVVNITFGDLSVELAAEGVSYAPDCMADMIAQAISAFDQSIGRLKAHDPALFSVEEAEEVEGE
jgi:hypothetical protein